jgi:hypothetical protein
MTTTPSDPAKGRALEQRIRDMLRLHGYDATTNVWVTGRSGASHEFDVVGEKADGLTSYRLVVECKAWAHPIDKDVVYKLSGELSDVGAARGVIVAPEGWTAQAAAVAGQLHIDLWGTQELNERLPLVGEGAVPIGRTPVTAPGVQFSSPLESGRQEVERAARGRLGIGRHEVAWFGAAWLPVWTLQLGLTRREGVLRRVDSVTHVWNDYEALDGTLVGQSSAEPNRSPVDIGDHPIPVRTKEKEVGARLADAERRWLRARDIQRLRGSDAALQRRIDARNAASKALAVLGVDPPADHIAVERATLTYQALWLGLLTRGDHERLVAVDGADGQLWPAISDVLTAHVQWVREALGGPAPAP